MLHYGRFSQIRSQLHHHLQMYALMFLHHFLTLLPYNTLIVVRCIKHEVLMILPF